MPRRRVTLSGAEHEHVLEHVETSVAEDLNALGEIDDGLKRIVRRMVELHGAKRRLDRERAQRLAALERHRELAQILSQTSVS